MEFTASGSGNRLAATQTVRIAARATGDMQRLRGCELAETGNARPMDLLPPDPKALWRAKIATALSRLAPRPHARALAQLRAAYPDLEPDELAERLVAGAARSNAAVGALAAGCSLAPVPAALPLASLGRAAADSALQLRLTAELHEVFGLPNPSPVNAGTTGYAAQWAARDGQGELLVQAVPPIGWALVRALPRTARKHLPNTRTLLAASALVAGIRSGRRTRRLGESLRHDLGADPTARRSWTDQGVDGVGG